MERRRCETLRPLRGRRRVRDAAFHKLRASDEALACGYTTFTPPPLGIPSSKEWGEAISEINDFCTSILNIHNINSRTHPNQYRANVKLLHILLVYIKFASQNTCRVQERVMRVGCNDILIKRLSAFLFWQLEIWQFQSSSRQWQW